MFPIDQMCGSHFLCTGQLSVYLPFTRKVSEVDRVMNFLVKRCDSVLGDFINQDGGWKFLHKMFANLLTNISAIIVINFHNTFSRRN